MIRKIKDIIGIDDEDFSIEKANEIYKQFAFVLVFKTFPFTRPIRPASAYKYFDIIKENNNEL